jgi:hypothetical protein
VFKEIILLIKGAEFVSDRISYIKLRGLRRDTIVLILHATMEYKTDDTEDSSCEELERVFEQYLEWNMRVYRECLCIDEERLCLQMENWE